MLLSIQISDISFSSGEFTSKEATQRVLMKTAAKTLRKKTTLMESFFSKVTKVWP